MKSKQGGSTGGSTTKQFKWGAGGGGKGTDNTGAMNTSLTCKDGTVVPVLFSGIVSATGIQFVYFIKDIRQIKENQKQYDLLLHNILPEAIIETLRKNPEADVSAQYQSVCVHVVFQLHAMIMHTG